VDDHYLISDPSIWCGIPVYNNAGTIVDIARRCREQIAHVLVVDDGSTDANLVDLLKPLDVRVFRLPTNCGKGKALRAAFAMASTLGAKYLITLDGDGQHFPEDLPRFIPYLSPDTVLIGYRDQITGEMPKRSRFGREFSDLWIRLEAGGNARDTQSGFRAYPLPAVLQMKIEARHYHFEMEIITRALWAGLAVGNVPIRVWYPPANERVSSFDPLRDNLRISLLHIKLILRQMLPVPHQRIRNDLNSVITGGGSPGLGATRAEDPGFRPGPLGRLPPPSMFAGKSASATQKFFRQGNDPIGLAISATLSIIMAIVLWPWGILPVAYVTIRLHLNKIIALACVTACIPTTVPRLCVRIGRVFVPSEAHPRLRWIVGSHGVALPIAAIVGCLTYAIAARFQKRSRAVPGRVRGEMPRLS
jgi:hypothetical protein